MEVGIEKKYFKNEDHACMTQDSASSKTLNVGKTVKFANSFAIQNYFENHKIRLISCQFKKRPYFNLAP